MTSARKQANAGRPRLGGVQWPITCALRAFLGHAIQHAASQEEVLIVLSERFHVFPGRGTMKAEEGRGETDAGGAAGFISSP